MNKNIFSGILTLFCASFVSGFSINASGTYNLTYGYFLYGGNSTTTGVKQYSINFSDDIYTNLNTSDSIEIGNNSTSTKGVISIL